MFDWKEVRTGLLIVFLGFIGSLLWTVIVTYSNDVSFVDAWKIVGNTEIKLWHCVILLPFIIIVTYKLSRPNPNAILRKRNLLRKVNSLMDDKEKTLIKWNVHFHYNGRPIIGDVTLYCTNHETVPLRFIDNRCPHADCKNNERWVNMTNIENGIQSLIDHKWDEINS